MCASGSVPARYDYGGNEGYRRRDHGASGSAQIKDVQGGSRCLQAVYSPRASDHSANACVLRPIRDRSVARRAEAGTRARQNRTQVPDSSLTGADRLIAVRGPQSAVRY